MLVIGSWVESIDWDPTPLLRALYENPAPGDEVCPLPVPPLSIFPFQPASSFPPLKQVELPTETEGGAEDSECIMKGYLEKLPKNNRKPNLLKRWLRRYFKMHRGLP